MKNGYIWFIVIGVVVPVMNILASIFCGVTLFNNIFAWVCYGILCVDLYFVTKRLHQNNEFMEKERKIILDFLKNTKENDDDRPAEQ